jgi:predicted  nucleic acid-binding Zn-ribbon protein
MHADLDRLIRLQSLTDRIERAREAIDVIPARLSDIDNRVVEAEAHLAAARARLEERQTRRRDVEKQMAAVQARLSKYKDQLMEVKTNKEYAAMQSEIATAQADVSRFEDEVLQAMMDADEIGALVKQAERALADIKAEGAQEKTRLEAERGALESQIAATGLDRQQLAAEISTGALTLFETLVRGRRGIAMSLARDGHCTECHVRLRPQLFNEVRRNDGIIQCDSCQRILYYVLPQESQGEPASHGK